MFSLAVLENKKLSSKARLTLLLKSLSLKFLISTPSISIEPDSISYNLGSRYASVDFPEPVEPTIATVFFPSISKVRSSNIFSFPYLKFTFENFNEPSPSSGNSLGDSSSVIVGVSLSSSRILFPAATLEGISDKNQAVILRGQINKKTYCVKAINSPRERKLLIVKYPPKSNTASVMTIGISSNKGTNLVLNLR